MFSLFSIVLIITSFIMLCLFYNLIYYKIKIHKVRLEMQEAGQINQAENLTKNLFFNLVFWFYPIAKYQEKGNNKHDKLAKKANYSLFGLILTFILFSFINILMRW